MPVCFGQCSNLAKILLNFLVPHQSCWSLTIGPALILNTAFGWKTLFILGALWRHTASDILVTISPGNELWPSQHLALNWTNADLLSIGHLIPNFKSNLDQNTNFHSKNAFEMLSPTCCPFCLGLNSLWPSDFIWWHRSRSTLAQVMAWCLMAPSHYLNQCWLLISVVKWH